MRRRATRLQRGETLAQELTALARTDRAEAEQFDRIGKLELLRLTDVGGIRLRQDDNFAEVILNRVQFLARCRQTRLSDYVNPCLSLAEVAAAEVAIVEKALTGLGHIEGAQGASTDPYYHTRSNP